MTDKNKENIAKLMLFAMSQAQMEQMEQASKDLAHFIKIQYDAYRAEGFSENDAQHFCNTAIAGIFHNIK